MLEAFNVDEFRKRGHELIDQLADHLDRCASGNHKVIQYVDPDEEYAFWKNYNLDSIPEYFKEITNRNIHVHHKKYIGHQVSAPAPLSALAGLVSDLLNDGMGIYEMGAAATAIERVVIEEFSSAIGFTEASSGFLTSGGTLANLTALLAARAKFQRTSEDPHPVILVSDQAHYCIERAAMTMGMSSGQVVKIPSSDSFTIDLDALTSTLDDVIAGGRSIMAIVACACSTSTGAYDDVSAVAEICRRYKTWLHVDGAHGGAVVFSKKYKKLVAGMEQADSIVIDAHKMMLTPALATAVLFRNAEDSYRAFDVAASYLFEGQHAEWHNLTKRTYETTKYMMCIKIFLLMRYYGLQLFDEFVTMTYDLAREFAVMIKQHPQFQLGHQPMSNIVCFRFANEDIDVDQATRLVRQRLLENGSFYVVQTTLRGHYYFRITIMSPHTTKKELHELLSCLEQLRMKITPNIS